MKLPSTFRSLAAVSGLLALAALPASADTINKANNNTALSDGASWTGGNAPGTGDIAAWTSANAGGSTPVSIGDGLSVLGIEYTSNPTTNMVISANGTNTLTIGASGINLRPSDFVSNRRFELSPLVVLGADQTWTPSETGLGQNSILVQTSAVISGSGRLTIAGTGNADSGLVRINSASTYSGGFQLNSGATFKVGVASVASAGTITSGAFGTGNVTINGGTLFGGADASAANIAINNDFTVNVGTNGANGRLGLGGAFDLGDATRTATLGRTFTTVAGAIGAGLESFRLAQVSNGPAISVSNGTLRVVSDSATDWVQFGVQASSSTFASNSGLTIGKNVVTYFSGINNLGTGADTATITVEDGGIFTLTSSGATGGRSQTIAGLNGAGTVTNLSTVAANALLTLGSNDTNGSFSGGIVDGDSLNAITGLTSVGIVSVTKTGNGTQTFSGTNTYSGATTVSAGTLLINGNSSGALGNVSVASGAILGGNGTIGGNTTINAGGRLSPGTSPGTTTFSQSLSLAGASFVDFEGGDLINVTGDLSLSSTWSLALGSGFLDGGTTTIFNYGSVGSFAAGSLDLARINTAGLGFTPVGPLSFTDTGSSIVLNGISVIPEPSTWALLAGALTMLVIFRRRQSRA